VLGVEVRPPDASARRRADAGRCDRGAGGERDERIPRSKSRKVNGYVRAVLALEAVRWKREERYDRYVRPLDRGQAARSRPRSSGGCAP
jgi:hypothetical protein